MPSLAPSISPSRAQAALGRKETEIYNGELGFLDLDNDPDVLECVGEQSSGAEAGPSKENETPPYLYLLTRKSAEEFVTLFPPVCLAEDCRHRLQLECLSCGLFEVPRWPQVDVAVS